MPSMNTSLKGDEGQAYTLLGKKPTLLNNQQGTHTLRRDPTQTHYIYSYSAASSRLRAAWLTSTTVLGSDMIRLLKS